MGASTGNQAEPPKKKIWGILAPVRHLCAWLQLLLWMDKFLQQLKLMKPYEYSLINHQPAGCCPPTVRSVLNFSGWNALQTSCPTNYHGTKKPPFVPLQNGHPFLVTLSASTLISGVMRSEKLGPPGFLPFIWLWVKSQIVPPMNIRFNPTTKIGSLKWVVNSYPIQPKWDQPKRSNDHHSSLVGVPAPTDSSIQKPGRPVRASRRGLWGRLRRGHSLAAPMVVFVFLFFPKKAEQNIEYLMFSQILENSK